MYFAELEGERGEVMRQMFATVRDSMPPGYELIDIIARTMEATLVERLIATYERSRQA